MKSKVADNSNNKPSITRVLLIENDPKDVHLIKEYLKEDSTTQFSLDYTNRLSTGLQRLSKEEYTVVLLELVLPDSEGIDTFTKVHTMAPEVPVIVNTRLNDENMAIKTLQNGAQDYLLKDSLDSNLLVRSIRYAIERQRLLTEIRSLSLTDDLTGLYNRRGFITLSEEHLKIAKRSGDGVHFLFIDMDSLKIINDNWGHSEGDNALKDIAHILNNTFRECDIIARIGGDEFGVLTLGSFHKSADVLTDRLQKKVNVHNSNGTRPYNLSISIGVESREPGSLCSPSELITLADGLMYKQKKQKHNHTG